MLQRKSNLFLLFIGINMILLCLMFVHSSFVKKANEPLLQEKREMVKRFELTDLCLFTDARYTRHPSMADLNTPFQDYPLSFEHFPSGSILTVPPHLKKKSVSVSKKQGQEGVSGGPSESKPEGIKHQ
jgi:hypothetical protein